MIKMSSDSPKEPIDSNISLSFNEESNESIQVIEESRYSKNDLLSAIDSELDNNQRHFHDCIAELVSLQNDVFIADLYKWRKTRPECLSSALYSAALDENDRKNILNYSNNAIKSEDFFLSNSFKSRLQDYEDDEEEFENSCDECDLLFEKGEIRKCAELEQKVLMRVDYLKKNGLWCGSDAVAPGVLKSKLSTLTPNNELPYVKDHSQYLFAEIHWLADDVVRERQWKKASAKRIAQACVKMCRERALKHLKAEREESIKVRKQCAAVAKIIREWWRQMDKIVQAKHQVRLTVKRQKAMTSHLGSVLETTEQYTRWLTEGIAGSNMKEDKKESNEEDSVQEVPDSTVEAKKEDESSSSSDKDSVSDQEFKADSLDSVDDEETIAKEEEQNDDDIKADEEKNLLENEAMLPITDLLPADYYDHPYPEEEVGEEQSSGSSVNFDSDDSEEDDEETIAKEEAIENEEDQIKADEEKQALENEADVPLEDLLPTDYFNQPYPEDKSDEQGSTISSSTTDDSSEQMDSETKVNQAEEDSQNETNDSQSSIKEEDQKPECVSSKDSTEEVKKSGDNVLQTLTADALSAHTIDIKVKAPFLLYGTLREYQLVGLNWLAAIYEKKLNGILADEMGLGKTIQTISLLSHLACDLGIWGPHLIIVPTSVLLNWEMEFKKWCPSFKILTYYGTLKERKDKRKGWTKTNAFHVCITSYRLATQDSIIFKRKKWRYLILDEAQNIKNFKSQRWQTLLTFNSQRRLLLTGTPLQNSLLELWSLMHFLMPNIFQSHREFQEWFASPLTGMIEGNGEFNEELISRLHRVLRPFLLRRLKADVEKQMPKKYEHVVMCRLSRRQRFLYDDFMSLSNTKDTLRAGHFLSVMNILMQLRKVCNHPDLFETRPIQCPFNMGAGELQFELPRLIMDISYPFLTKIPLNHTSNILDVGTTSAFTCVDVDWLDRAGATHRLLGQMQNLAEMSRDLPSFIARKVHRMTPKHPPLIEVDNIDVQDYVSMDRHKLQPFGDFSSSKDDNKHTRIFLPKNEVLKLNEEYGIRPGQNSRSLAFQQAYPRLPLAKNYEPSINEVNPEVNSWDIGVPKAVFHRRMSDRRDTLRKFEHRNARRCNPLNLNVTLKTTTIGDALGGHSWSCTSGNHLGCDTIRLASRLGKEQCFTKQAGYITCQRVSTEITADADTKDCSNLDRVDLASGFHPFKAEDGSMCMNILSLKRIRWKGTSLGPECAMIPSHSTNSSSISDCLRDVIKTPLKRIELLDEELYRFSFLVPEVLSVGIQLQSSQGVLIRMADSLDDRVRTVLQPILPSVCHKVINSTGRKNTVNKDQALSLNSYVMPRQLHSVYNQRFFQFPDLRLIQYDCGKLQRLDMLLRELKSGSHRVLIFTQMARMLDILEQFLAYHGHRYLRLDGTTKVEQRQLLMERFNQDTRIFAFILSTRSGGLGVNLTGADTVVFYDSDWNPTMDAQAQDRCHRIGQTRDVHIYRLISERTVEENILRKANQKRFLSDIAIEKGKFTTAFFKQNTITELFAEPTGVEDVAADRQRMEESKRLGGQSNKENDPPPAPTLTAKQLAAAFEACEDENDCLAAKRVIDEVQADIDEFDEAVTVDEDGKLVTNELDPLSRFAQRQREVAKDVEKAPGKETVATENEAPEETTPVDPQEEAERVAERELEAFESQLTPIERFGVLFSTYNRNEILSDELTFEEAKLEQSKKNWKLDQLKALREADEERADLEEDDILYCHGKYDPAERLAELNRLEQELLDAPSTTEDESVSVDIDENPSFMAEDIKPKYRPLPQHDAIPKKRGPGRPPTKRFIPSQATGTSENSSSSSSEAEYSYDEMDRRTVSSHQSSKSAIPRVGRGRGRGGVYQDRNRPYQSAKHRFSNRVDLDYDEYLYGGVEHDQLSAAVDLDDDNSWLSEEAGIPRCGGRGRLPAPGKRKRGPKMTSARHGGQFGGIEDDFVYYDSQFKRPSKLPRSQLGEGRRSSDIGMKRGRYNGEHLSDVENAPDFKRQRELAHSTGSQQSTMHKFLTNTQTSSSFSMNAQRNLAINSVEKPVPLNLQNTALSSVCSFNTVRQEHHGSNDQLELLKLPVHSVTGQNKMEIPIQQILRPQGKPVFVVTRKLKTPHGKVLERRFTHAVKPEPDLSRAMQEMHSFLDKIHPVLSPTHHSTIPTTSVSSSAGQTKLNNISAMPVVDKPSQSLPSVVHIPSADDCSYASSTSVKITPTKRVVPVIQPVRETKLYTPGGLRIVRPCVNNAPQKPTNSAFLVRSHTPANLIKVKSAPMVMPANNHVSLSTNSNIIRPIVSNNAQVVRVFPKSTTTIVSKPPNPVPVLSQKSISIRPGAPLLMNSSTVDGLVPANKHVILRPTSNPQPSGPAGGQQS